jgi:NAD(P)-dependent dehydrogenase (short-subunit alcohol dehydrogenase family)
MREFGGKTAVVTGGASGVGRALGRRFAQEGMRVVLADVESAALDRTTAELRGAGLDVTGIVTDVTRYDSVKALARQTVQTHGAVHVLCNNAGVGTNELQTMLWQSPGSDWQWVLAVNVWGVLHGVKAFVPDMLEHGQEGHVVNTSSGNGGLFPLPMTPIYATSKAAVTTISEVLHYQLHMVGAKLKASVLFPGPHTVNTNIFQSARNRPAQFAPESTPAPAPTLDELRAVMESAGREFHVTEPEDVAEYTLAALRRDQFWILPPSAEQDAKVRERLESILARRDPVLNLW